MLTSDSEICGTEQILLSLLRHVDRTRFEVALVTMFGPGDLNRAAKEMGVEGINLGMREGAKWKGLYDWWRFVRQWKPDVIQSLLIHSNVLGRMTRLFFPRIRLLAGISTVYTVEGYGRFYALIEGWTHFLDTLYVINSRLGYDNVVDLMGLPEKKLALVHNGIETSPLESIEQDRRDVREEFGFRGEDVVIGMIAQFRPAKRHDLMLQAMAKVAEKHPNVRGLFVGQGEREQACKEMAEQLGIADQIGFAGYRNDARRFYRGMDVFCLPSDVEGEPVSLLEAMDAGLPIVAARTGGIPEIVEAERSGLLFEPGDLAGLTQQIKRVLACEEERRRLGEKARERVLEAFSAERMAKQFEELYERCK